MPTFSRNVGACVIFIAVMLSVAQLYAKYAGQGGSDSETQARLSALEQDISTVLHLGKLLRKQMFDQDQRVANLERFTNVTRVAPTLAPTVKCQRVLGSLSCWTPLPAGTNASRCAVVVLANPAHRPLRALPADVRTNALLKGLRMFMHNYNTRFTTAHHDIVIFHEDYTDCDMEHARQAVGPGSTVR